MPGVEGRMRSTAGAPCPLAFGVTAIPRLDFDRVTKKIWVNAEGAQYVLETSVCGQGSDHFDG